MGTLDQPEGSVTKREIKFVDVTSYTPSQIENAYNNNYGLKGWKIIQIVEVGTKRYIVAEREV